MTELTKTDELLLMAIWRLKDEAYGYRIKKYISETINKDFTYGNLYSGLSQLVKKEFVIKRPDSSDQQKQGKQKMYYSVSSSGIQALKASRTVHNTLWDGISDYSLDNTQ